LDFFEKKELQSFVITDVSGSIGGISSLADDFSVMDDNTTDRDFSAFQSLLSLHRDTVNKVTADSDGMPYSERF
jgi:hypothetical protein